MPKKIEIKDLKEPPKQTKSKKPPKKGAIQMLSVKNSLTVDSLHEMHKAEERSKMPNLSHN